MKIAILEDDENDYSQLQTALTQYAGEKNLLFELIHFSNPITFLNNYKSEYDLIFMDIRMPYMDGMEASTKLRQIDPEVILIFITTMGQLANRGYDVDASAFLVKPVKYFDLCLTLERVLKKITPKEEKLLVFQCQNKISTYHLDDIYFLEVYAHDLIVHSKLGDIHYNRPLSEIEEELQDTHKFFRCNKCYLVNLAYVEKIEGYEVIVKGNPLTISHPKKKEFLKAYQEYLSRK